MEREKLWCEFMDLAPEDRQKVADFIASLGGEARSTRSPNPTNLKDEPFISVWGGREDLKDGTVWVRESREREWSNRRG